MPKQLNLQLKHRKQQLKNLSRQLTERLGKGFDVTNLRNMRRFYAAYPIRETLSLELSWSHYNLLARIESTSARQWYGQEAASHAWSVPLAPRRSAASGVEVHQPIEVVEQVRAHLLLERTARRSQRVPEYALLPLLPVGVEIHVVRAPRRAGVVAAKDVVGPAVAVLDEGEAHRALQVRKVRCHRTFNEGEIQQ